MKKVFVVMIVLVIGVFGCAKSPVLDRMADEYTLDSHGKIRVVVNENDESLMKRLIITEIVTLDRFINIANGNQVKAIEKFQKHLLSDIDYFSSLPSTALSMFDDFSLNSSSGKLLSVSILKNKSELSGVDYEYVKIMHFDFSAEVTFEDFMYILAEFYLSEAHEGFRSMNYYLLKKSKDFVYYDIFRWGVLDLIRN